MKIRCRKKNFGLFIVFFIIVQLGLLCLIDYAAYKIYMHQIDEPVPYSNQILAVKYLDKAAMLKLGWVGIENKKNKFTNFDLKKEKGILRVGCFGDSFVEGQEVLDGQDYPAVLADLMNSGKNKKVEVINFGVPGYGFHQTFILFNELAEKFDLDYAVFGPSGFNPEREHTFSFKINNKNSKYALHARYVIDGQDIKLIEVIGDDYISRSNNYYRFMPHDQYLKYDYYAPAFLACLVGANRKILNPFYYYNKSMIREAENIYEKILIRLAKRPIEMIFIEYDNKIVSIVNKLKHNNLQGCLIKRFERFPYKTVKGHNSALANEILAAQVEGLIKNKDRFQIRLLDIKDNYGKKKLVPGLDNISKVFISINNQKVGVFSELKSPDNLEMENIYQIFDHTARSLLVFDAGIDTILDGCFLPLDIRIGSDQVLDLCLKDNSDGKVYNLAKVKLIIDELKIAGLDDYNFTQTLNGEDYFFKLKPELEKKLDGNKRSKSFSVLLQGRKICAARYDSFLGKFKMIPVDHDFRVIRTISDCRLNFDDLPETGKVNMVCKDEKNKLSAVQLAEYTKKRFEQKICQ
jgi:hypothetical protein